MALAVHEGEGEDGSILEQDFESNPVTVEEFGEYVASLHSCNNSTFVLQYEVTQSLCHNTKLHTNGHMLKFHIIVIDVRRRGSRS